MALSELIKYEGDNSTFIWKYPHEDFNSMTELVVHESQEAIFFANGQAADTFGPGRYKLDADNIPILTKMINLVTGVSVFHCEVYFINKTVQMAVKWGTDSKIRFVEPTLGVPVELGACGEMNLAVSDGRKLLISLVGTMKGIAWGEEGKGFTKSLQSSFRPLISTTVKSKLPAAIRERGLDLVELDEHLAELSQVLREQMLPGFEQYGLTVPQFYLENVVLPEQDPNYRRLVELHTLSLKQQMARAEAEIRTSQAESRAAYRTAEAAAETKIKSAEREALLEEQTTETEIARRKAERQLIQAQVDAEAARIAGLAEASVMQAKGYTQKDVLRADVQKAFAEGIGNMGPAITSGGGSSVMGDVLGLGIGLSAMKTMTPQLGELMGGLQFGGEENSAGLQTGDTSPAVSEGKLCANCGKPLPAGAKFCLECGTKVEQLTDNEMLCPSCGKKTAKGKFCMECGQPLSRSCPNCGAELQTGAKFCPECGTKLNG